MKDIKPINAVILAGAGICSVIVAFIVGNVVKHTLDAMTR